MTEHLTNMCTSKCCVDATRKLEDHRCFEKHGSQVSPAARHQLHEDTCQQPWNEHAYLLLLDIGRMWHQPLQEVRNHETLGEPGLHGHSKREADEHFDNSSTDYST